MSVYAVENLPRKWYTGEKLIDLEHVKNSADEKSVEFFVLET